MADPLRSQIEYVLHGQDGSSRDDNIRFVHLLMNCVPSLKNSLGKSAISWTRSDILCVTVGKDLRG